MRSNPGKSCSSQRVANHLPQINGKTIVACGLVLTLIFMWVKVFIGDPKEEQEISGALAVSTAKAQNKRLVLKRVPLAYVSGRHDRLTADMFSPRDMEVENDDLDVSREGQDRVERIRSQKSAASKLAKKLELDAIILGVNKTGHQAFINGKLQVEGDELSVKLNGQTYKLSVMEIFHNKVVLKWNDYTISVRMAKLDKVN